jgi:hypothetical protein
MGVPVGRTASVQVVLRTLARSIYDFPSYPFYGLVGDPLIERGGIKPSVQVLFDESQTQQTQIGTPTLPTW